MQHAFTPRQFKVSIKTAIIVGSLLNVINQWQAITGEADIQWVKLGLTFIVPFCVASYAGAKASINCLGSAEQ